jgi:uncharacterized protein involved in exopolysaccharide biosynthesis
MSDSASDLGAERDIDLRSMGRSIRARIWIVIAGGVAGIVLGSLYSLSGGSLYNATAYLAPGQIFSPGGGTAVLTYLSSPAAINALATSAGAIDYAAKQAKMTPGELRGHITTAPVSQGSTTTTAARTAALIGITVQLNRGKRAETAANAIASYIKNNTTPKYVDQSIGIYDTRLGNYSKRIETLDAKIKSLNQELSSPGSLSIVDRLFLVTELDSAEAALGTTLDSQEQTLQAKILAKDIETTQLVGGTAKFARTTGRSRRNSIIVGLVIGLLIGAAVAIIVDTRSRRRVQPA